MQQKIIHNIWIQGYENLPEQTKENHIQIKKLNPDWEFIIWDDKMILDLLQKYPKILNIYKNIDKYYGIISNENTKSHIARYIILKEYGGIYYDLDYECVTSFNNLFDNKNGERNIKNTIYVANSKIPLFYYIYPFYKPKYCDCFITIERENPIMQKVIQRLFIANNKYEICNALDHVLQNNINDFNIIMVNQVNGYYEYLQNNNDSDKNISYWYTPLLQFLIFYYKQFLLIIFIFLIIFSVDKISKYNAQHHLSQTQNDFLFPFGSLQQPLSQNILKRENRKLKRKH